MCIYTSLSLSIYIYIYKYPAAAAHPRALGDPSLFHRRNRKSNFPIMSIPLYLLLYLHCSSRVSSRGIIMLKSALIVSHTYYYFPNPIITLSSRSLFSGLEFLLGNYGCRQTRENNDEQAEARAGRRACQYVCK